MYHISRIEAEAAECKRLGAHRLVHNDFTPNFKQTIQPLLDESNSNPSRITVFNLWRRFDEDGVDAPFALCDSRTVSEKELIPTDLFNYGKEEEKSDTHADENGFTVEIYQSMNSDEHQWYFYPKCIVMKSLCSKHMIQMRSHSCQPCTVPLMMRLMAEKTHLLGKV